jgi:predicted chitinase
LAVLDRRLQYQRLEGLDKRYAHVYPENKPCAADARNPGSFDAITFAINGRYTGKEPRVAYYWQARGVLGCP